MAQYVVQTVSSTLAQKGKDMAAGKKVDNPWGAGNFHFEMYVVEAIHPTHAEKAVKDYFATKLPRRRGLKIQQVKVVKATI